MIVPNWTITSNEPNEKQKQKQTKRIEIHQSQRMTP